MKADANPRHALLACKQVLEATFDHSNWIELGYLTDSLDAITDHPRLLRSLSFGDDDYGFSILSVLPGVLGEDLEHLAAVEAYAGVEEWLRANDSALHEELYGGHLTIDEPDLSALEDPSAIEAHLRRINAAVAADPELAIGAAKELVESTAKLVLKEVGVAFDHRADLPALVKLVQTALSLHPATVAPTATGAQATKKVLSGLTSIAIGVGELRNLYGTGHGPAASRSGLRPRHAQLAVDAAMVYCRTLLATLSDPDAPWRTRRP